MRDKFVFVLLCSCIGQSFTMMFQEIRSSLYVPVGFNLSKDGTSVSTRWSCFNDYIDFFWLALLIFSVLFGLYFQMKRLLCCGSFYFLSSNLDSSKNPVLITHSLQSSAIEERQEYLW